jgi:hypothetical protein
MLEMSRTPGVFSIAGVAGRHALRPSIRVAFRNLAFIRMDGPHKASGSRWIGPRVEDGEVLEASTDKVLTEATKVDRVYQERSRSRRNGGLRKARTDYAAPPPIKPPSNDDIIALIDAAKICLNLALEKLAKRN